MHYHCQQLYMYNCFLPDIKDLVFVNACMVDLADHWVRLGECLRVTEAKLGIIQAQNPDYDVRKCLIEMLAEWLNNDLEPTWERVVIAIATAVGDQSATKVAEKLQSKSQGGYTFYYNSQVSLPYINRWHTQSYH